MNNHSAVSQNRTSPAIATLPNGKKIGHMNPTETWLIYDEIFREKIYDQINVHLDDNATIIDIGANIGLFLLYATENYRNLKIFCFEPIPETFGVLAHNRALIPQEDHQIELNNQGVWKEKGTTQFRHLPRFSCSSTMCPDDSPQQEQRALEFTLNAFDQHPNRLLSKFLGILPGFVRRTIARTLMKQHAKHETIECELTSVADILRERKIEQVDYLKLDAEGAEIEILEAIPEEDWGKIRQIVVETHRGDEAMQSVEKILGAHGFETSIGFSQSSPADKMVYGTRMQEEASNPDKASVEAV